MHLKNRPHEGAQVEETVPSGYFFHLRTMNESQFLRSLFYVIVLRSALENFFGDWDMTHII